MLCFIVRVSICKSWEELCFTVQDFMSYLIVGVVYIRNFFQATIMYTS